jgi:hypothetical protein
MNPAWRNSGPLSLVAVLVSADIAAEEVPT